MKETLHKWYDCTNDQAKFLLGGIGTGNVSLGSRGQLCDWEIFNKPSKGRKISNTFFAIRTETPEGAVDCKILESQILPPYEEPVGYPAWESAGIPRFKNARLNGEVSLAIVEFEDTTLPVEVRLEALSPFIPLDVKNSAIPAVSLKYNVKNKTQSLLKVSVCGTLSNPIGFCGYAPFGLMLTEGNKTNGYREDERLRGIFYTNDLPPDDLRAGSMALTAAGKHHVTCKPQWLESGWWDGNHDFWDDFAGDGRLEPAVQDEIYLSRIRKGPMPIKTGSLCMDFTLQPGGEDNAEFVLSWYFPERKGYWDGQIIPIPEKKSTVKNYYASLFGDAWDVARYFEENEEYLKRNSRLFREALYASTLPANVIDALSANLTVIRSTTCFLINDGTFLSWEGCTNTMGSCEGNCTHVWNYAQSMAFLFPKLEHDMRRTEFLLETDKKGEMAYRSNCVIGGERYTGIPPAVDGQMGSVIRLYRDWKLSGDFSMLRELWEGARHALEYALTVWDSDGDFVLDAEQHNTYDIEFYGKNSMTNSIFFAALKAAAMMAAQLGYYDLEEKYLKVLKDGSVKMDQELYNGEYYIQIVPENAIRHYQYFSGCLSDQVFGQQLAHVAGLGYILPKEHVTSALQAIFHNNFIEGFQKHLNVQRAYAINDESGLILCSWPRGGRPKVPFVYSDEVWTGIEYQVASHLVYEGQNELAFKIVEGVRQRYDGVKRNPWNEVECGNHYVRSMASWGLLLALSGYTYDLPNNRIGFAPRIYADDFSCFFSTAKCWGIYRQRKGASGEVTKEIEVLWGEKGVELQ